MITSVTTLPNGQVTTTLIPTLVTPRPSQVYVPTTALVEETGMSGSGSPKGAKLGVVVGAVIGGFIGLCLIILALWYVRCVAGVRVASRAIGLILLQTKEENDLR